MSDRQDELTLESFITGSENKKDCAIYHQQNSHNDTIQIYSLLNHMDSILATHLRFCYTEQSGMMLQNRRVSMYVNHPFILVNYYPQ